MDIVDAVDATGLTSIGPDLPIGTYGSCAIKDSVSHRVFSLGGKQVGQNSVGYTQ